MIVDPCTPEELAEWAAMSAWLKARGLTLHCTYTARRKPKEIKMLLRDKRTGRGVASA